MNERTGNEQHPVVLPANPRDLVPIEDIGNSPVLRMMGLSERFPQRMRELNDVMAAARMTSGPGSIDLVVYPDAEHPIVEQHVNPMGSLHLKVHLEPATKTVKIRSSWQNVDSDDYQSREFFSLRPSGYCFTLTDLRKFVGEVYPGKRAEAKGRSLNFEKHDLVGQWDLSRVRIDSLERFWWRCADADYSKEERRSIPLETSPAEWEVQVEGIKKPLFVFQLLRGAAMPGRKPKTLLAVPHIFWEGPSSQAEGVMDSFTELIGKCEYLGKKRR
mgnify:CR=1 FL=1